MQVQSTPNAPQGIAPAYGQKALVDLLAKSMNDPGAWVTVNQDSQDLLSIYLLHKARGPLQRAYTSTFQAYSGPFWVGESRKHWSRDVRLKREALQTLLAHLEQKYDHVVLYPEDLDWRVPQQRGWALTPRFCLEYHFGTDPLDLDTDTMRMVRKATKSGVRIEKATQWSNLGPSYERTFHKQGIPVPQSTSSVVELCQNAMDANLVEAYTALNSSGDPIAYLSLIPPNSTGRAYLFWNSSHPESDQCGALYLLLYHAMEQLQGRCQVLDLLGADHTHVSQFKEHFSNHLAHRYALEWIRSPVTKLAMNTFTAIRSRFR